MVRLHSAPSSWLRPVLASIPVQAFARGFQNADFGVDLLRTQAWKCRTRLFPKQCKARFEDHEKNLHLYLSLCGSFVCATFPNFSQCVCLSTSGYLSIYRCVSVVPTMYCQFSFALFLPCLPTFQPLLRHPRPSSRLSLFPSCRVLCLRLPRPCIDATQQLCGNCGTVPRFA